MSDFPSASYDAWKLMSPDDERPQDEDDDEECQFCGARPDEGCLLEADCDEGEDPPCAVFGRMFVGVDR